MIWLRHEPISSPSFYGNSALVISSDDKGFLDLKATRELIDGNKGAFVKAKIEISVSHPVRLGLRLIQKFNFEEILSDASLGMFW